ncbi:pentapeptide repeat-containing protein [Saccharomonospora sp. NPDC006951]
MNRVRVALRSPLFGTVLCAVLLVLAISVWLLTDGKTSRSDALRTGGLAGGAIVALYALWLNDRRRRVEEARQDIERRRHELESRRISDERFARAIELLGDEADQVRVGALHVLAGLAKSRPGYTQTVLDVVCAYLRRPYSHPRLTGGKGAPAPATSLDGVDPRETAERELQVRLTAQRILLDLLPEAGQPEAPSYDLDLTGATLEYLDCSGRKLGTVLMRYAKLHSSINFSDCDFGGPVWFTAASTNEGRLTGRFRCTNSTFRERAWFSGTEFGELADFTGTTFIGQASFKDATFNGDALFGTTSFHSGLDLRRARFASRLDLRWKREPETISLYNTVIEPEVETDLPENWATTKLPDGQTKLTAPPAQPS